ncbi:hypothetical protein [Escherichia coli]|nr:hypothetical protein [Escherichia coli]
MLRNRARRPDYKIMR